MPKARIKIIDGEMFVSVADIKTALNDPEYLTECAMMIKAAKEFKHPALIGVKMCIIAAIDGVTGVTEAQMRSLTPEVDKVMKHGRAGNNPSPR